MNEYLEVNWGQLVGLSIARCGQDALFTHSSVMWSFYTRLTGKSQNRLLWAEITRQHVLSWGPTCSFAQSFIHDCEWSLFLLCQILFFSFMVAVLPFFGFITSCTLLRASLLEQFWILQAALASAFPALPASGSGAPQFHTWGRQFQVAHLFCQAGFCLRALAPPALSMIHRRDQRNVSSRVNLTG